MATRTKTTKPKTKASKTAKTTKPKTKASKTAKTPAFRAQDPKEKALLDAIWANPDDVETLRVYADYLTERGSSRGEFIQLSLIKRDEKQDERWLQLSKNDRGAWLGAARPFVRSWELARRPAGFVSLVWCEADKLLAGFDHIIGLGPRLVVSVTSMRKERRDTEARMAALPLHRIYDLDLGSNALDDKSLATLAPALAGIGGLQLAYNEITGAGMRELGRHVTTLEFLQVGMAIKFSRDQREVLVDRIAEAIATTPGFRSLRYLHFFRTGSPSPARAKQLHELPNLKRISVSEYVELEGRDPKSWADAGPDDI
jgi:uncharacterized protein (TIGR02996 family)